MTEEDRALLARHGEPGYFSQAFGIFRGPMAKVMWLVNVAAGVAFVAGAYALWQSWGASDALVAVKWGVVERILWAWVLTLPVTGLLGYGLLRLCRVAGI